MPKDSINEIHPRIGEIPFDSDRKLMSTINKFNDKNIVIVKGAFDILSKRCIKGDIDKASQITNEMSTNALRVLALSQVVQAFNMRSEHSLFKIGAFSNKTLNKASFISALLVALVIFTPVRTIFGLITLSPSLYFTGLGLIIVPVIVMELSKALGFIKHHK